MLDNFIVTNHSEYATLIKRNFRIEKLTADLEWTGKGNLVAFIFHAFYGVAAKSAVLFWRAIMSVFRIAKHTQNYSIIDNSGVQDTELSAKAKGLLWYFLTLPDEWEIRMIEVQRHFKDGRDALNSALYELIEAQYVQKNKIRVHKMPYRPLPK